MRRLLTIVTAGLLAFSSTAFAQNVQPVLIGQGSPMATTTQSSSSGEDALAQVPNSTTGGIFSNPLLAAGLITAAIAIPVAIAVSNNDDDDTPVSP